MAKYIVALIIMAIGVILIMKTEWFLSFFGRIDWAESKLGAEGGSRIFYKLLGLAAILISFLIMSGKLETGIDKIFLR